MFDVFLINKEKNEKSIIEKAEFEKIELTAIKSQYRKKFYWINCVDPTEEEIDALFDLTGIKKNHFSDVLLDTERSTLIKGKWLFISYRALNQNMDSTTPLGIFSYKNLLITIEKEPLKSITKYKYLLSEKKGNLLFEKGKVSFICRLFDNINDGFKEKINDEMKKTKLMEETGFGISTKKIESIYSAIVTHIYLQNALSSNMEVLNAIMKGKLREFNQLSDEYREVYEDVKELLYMENMQRNITTTLFDFHSSYATHEINKTMKKITGWGFVIMIPTLIASIYGMNFKIIPLSQGYYDFFIVNFIMIVIMFVCFGYLKKIKWL